MNFVLTRGKPFREFFEFKNAQGRPITMPAGEFRLVLERGSFVREYNVARGGLQRSMNKINWTIAAEDTVDFEFSTLYYTLYLDDRELVRGIIRVQ